MTISVNLTSSGFGSYDRKTCFYRNDTLTISFDHKALFQRYLIPQLYPHEERNGRGGGS
jgi:hypothetical protein